MSPPVRTAGPILALLVLGLAPPADAAKGEKGELAAPLLGVDLTKTPNLTPEQHEHAAAAGEEVVCLCGTCPRRTITDCECGYAHREKKLIQLAVENGKSQDEIIAAYVSAYGTKVRPNPPDDSLGRMSYVLPFTLIAAALVLVILIGVRLRKQEEIRGAVAPAAPGRKDPSPAVVSEQAQAALARELEELD